MAELKTGIRWGAWLAIAGGVVFVLCLGLLHWLAPEFLPRQHSISQYTYSDYAYLLAMAFVALGIGMAAAAYSLVVEAPSETGSRAGVFLLLIASFGFFFMAVFSADPGDAAETIQGKMHAFSYALAAVTAMLGGLLVSLRLRNSGGFFEWMALILNLAGWGSYLLPRFAPLTGNLVGRVTLGAMALWLVLVGGLIQMKDH